MPHWPVNRDYFTISFNRNSNLPFLLDIDEALNIATGMFIEHNNPIANIDFGSTATLV
jgi:hypothetical protein